MEKHTKDSPLREKTLNFAVRIVDLNKYLAQKKQEYVMSKQVLRSATNPGAMVREATNAESAPDFIHKLSVAQKEIGETLYWLELLFRTNYLTSAEYTSINADGEEIMRMIRSAILTKKKNLALKITSLIVTISIIVVILTHNC
jgi:four helix bundle protein